MARLGSAVARHTRYPATMSTSRFQLRRTPARSSTSHSLPRAFRPLRGGAITDFEITERMIRLLLQRR